MNKANVFCSSKFYMGVGDVLHLLLIDEAGTPIEVELSTGDDNYAPSAPTALPATAITDTGFTANWYFNENSMGYYLDVATDIGFTAYVAGFNNHDAGNNASHAITGLTVATPYYYRVRAYNDYGTSPNSNIITTGTTNPYGALYNWYAASYSAGGASLAPSGWHVPSASESNVLRNFNGGWLVNGGHLKETGFTHWISPNTDADNTYDFNARGSGQRSGITGLFSSINELMVIHTSDDYDGVSTYGLSLQYNSASATTHNSKKKDGFSIRPIKDDATDPVTVTDIDGNVYPTVKIGTQVWFKENLKVTHYNDGTTIPVLTDNTQWVNDTAGAMCRYNNTAP